MDEQPKTVEVVCENCGEAMRVSPRITIQLPCIHCGAKLPLKED